MRLSASQAPLLQRCVVGVLSVIIVGNSWYAYRCSRERVEWSEQCDSYQRQIDAYRASITHASVAHASVTDATGANARSATSEAAVVAAKKSLERLTPTQRPNAEAPLPTAAQMRSPTSHQRGSVSRLPARGSAALTNSRLAAAPSRQSHSADASGVAPLSGSAKEANRKRPSEVGTDFAGEQGGALVTDKSEYSEEHFNVPHYPRALPSVVAVIRTSRRCCAWIGSSVAGEWVTEGAEWNAWELLHVGTGGVVVRDGVWNDEYVLKLKEAI